MNIDLTKPSVQSTFLSTEKDIQTILKRIFVEGDPRDIDALKRLLVINTPDCLDNFSNIKYKEKLEQCSVSYLKRQGYIRLAPKLTLGDHEEIKSYILITFNDFTPNRENPLYRDCTISFDIICSTDSWDLGNYRIRPLKILGYIDGVMNNARLSGIGTLNFLGANELILDETLSGYSLMYRAIHGSDDWIPGE